MTLIILYVFRSFSGFNPVFSTPGPQGDYEVFTVV